MSPHDAEGCISFVHAQGPDGVRPQVLAWSVSIPSRPTQDLIEHPPGTRWLTRWEKEVDLIVKLAYHGLTTGLGQ